MHRTPGKPRPAAPLLSMIALFTVVGPLSAQRWDGTVRDSAGITVVENGDQGVWTSTNRWRIEPSGILIGSADGDPDYEFGMISGIAVTDDGRIFVFDQQGQQLKVFDESGNYLNTIGGPGGGPGEFGPQAGPVILGTGDTLYIPDLTNRRVDRFTTDGESAGSYVLDIIHGIPLNWSVTTDGFVVSHLRPLPNQNSAPGDTLDVVLVRAGDGTVVDTVLRMPSGRTFVLNPGALPEWNFFVPEPAWALGEGQAYYYGISDDYRIGAYDEAGNLALLITKPFETETITGREQDVFNGFFENILREQPGVTPDILPVLMDNVSFNETYPAYMQLMSGPAGTLWVQHIQRISDLTGEQAENFDPRIDLGAPEWDVFGPDGRFLGEVMMPSRFQPIRFEGSDIYGIWRDEYDVQYVLKVAVVGTRGGDT